MFPWIIKYCNSLYMCIFIRILCAVGNTFMQEKRYSSTYKTSENIQIKIILNVWLLFGALGSQDEGLMNSFLWKPQIRLRFKHFSLFFCVYLKISLCTFTLILPARVINVHASMTCVCSCCIPVAPSTPICNVVGKTEYFENIQLTCRSEEGTPTPTYKWQSHGVNNVPRPLPLKATDRMCVMLLKYMLKPSSPASLISVSVSPQKTGFCRSSIFPWTLLATTSARPPMKSDLRSVMWPWPLCHVRNTAAFLWELICCNLMTSVGLVTQKM